MSGIFPDYEYDIFISYRQKDNKYDGWVTEFVSNLKKELEATFKEDISIYFDENPHDGLLETHAVEKSLEGKLKSLILIPVISQTYCDPNSFAWQYEFCPFNKSAKEDNFGRDVILDNGNVASRVLPVKIHEIAREDQQLFEKESGAALRAIDFIYKEPGVNRPLKSTDNKNDNQNKTDYRNQINKVANAVKDLVNGLKKAENRSGKNDKKPVSDRVYSKSSARKKPLLVLGIFGILGLAAFFLFSSGEFGKSETSPQKKSIAVLYFNNMSGDQQQEYFCDGITEEIITKLSMINGLKVTSRTSVYQYKNEKKNAREIAKELGVTKILEGSLRKEDDKIMVTAHLIDAVTDDYIWSETYDRDLKDIFEVQSDIAQHIASKFQLRLSVQEKKNIFTPPTLNTTAYDKYLMAASIAYMDWGLGAEPVNLLKANNLLREAIRLDPDFSEAYLMLSWNYSNYSSYVENPRNWLDSAKLLARKVIHYNPLKAEGYDALANVFWMEGNSEEALKWQLKSHELDPYKSADMVARFYTSMNDYGKAMEWLLKAIQQDPAEYRFYIAKSELFYELDLLDSMRLSLDEARRIKPELFNGEGWAINYYLMTSNYEQFEHLTRSRYANFDKEFAYQLAMFYFLQRDWHKADSLYSISTHPDDIDAGLVKIHLGEKKLGTQFLKAGIERRIHFRDYNGPWNLYDISRAYAALHDNRYIEYMNIATTQKGWHVYSWFKRDPFYDFVRDTPEYKELAHQMEERNNRYKADLFAAMNVSYRKN
jgi:TolB-like protein